MWAEAKDLLHQLGILEWAYQAPDGGIAQWLGRSRGGWKESHGHQLFLSGGIWKLWALSTAMTANAEPIEETIDALGLREV